MSNNTEKLSTELKVAESEKIAAFLTSSNRERPSFSIGGGSI